MSYEDGLAAINLEMPARVPHIEFDAETHWSLVKAVTGFSVSPDSPDTEKQKASGAFIKAWNYDLSLQNLINDPELDARRTKMGHAEYAEGGIDFSDDISCPFSDPEEVFSFDPVETYGMHDHAETVRRFNEHLAEHREWKPDLINSTGTYVTLFSGFIAMLGWEMFILSCGVDADRLGKVVNRYAVWMQQYYDALADSDVEVIYSHDDIVWSTGAVFQPEWYRKYIFPNYKKFYAPVLEAGKKVIFIADGNYTEFVDDVAQTNASGFFLEPLTDLEYVAERYGKTHIIVGNADTRILLSSTKEDIRSEVRRCLDIGKKCPGYFLSVSNMIPHNTPVENALYYYNTYMEMSKR